MKKLLLTLTVLVLLSSLLAVPAFAGEHLLGTCGEYLTWTYDVDEGILSISGEGEMYDYAQTAPPWSEYSGEINELVMADTVTSISENAFMGCENLYVIRYDGTLAQWVDTKIGLGNWELGKAAIFASDWKPNEYSHFGYFGDMGDRVLWLLDGKGTLYVYGTGYADDQCKNPPAWEEWKDEIGWVYVKDGILGLDDLAFSECYNLETVELADSVEYLGVGCFSDCPNLKEAKLASKTDWRDIPGSLFSGCSSLVKVNIPEGTPTISDLAFYQCTALEEITIPESVKFIEANAFMGCSSLKKVHLPQLVNRLKSSSRLDDYGKSPFAGCSSLEEFTVSEDNKDFSADEQGALYNKDKTRLIQVPATKTGTFIVPETVTYIWAGAFQDCVGLTEIVLPDGLESMHNKVFQNCTGLKEITIPNSVTEIGYDIFWKCSNLESVKMSEQVTILDGTFMECTSLKEYDIPESVTELGYRTFYGCTELERVSIPASVTKIGKESFAQCPALTEVQYDGYVGEWNQITIVEGNDCLTDEIVRWKTCAEHETVIVPAIAPNCTEDGYTESSSCAACGEVFAVQELIPATGHDVTDGVCANCGETVEWYYNGVTRTLTVCCVGPMDDYNGELDAPWDEFREEIQHVVIAEGVTRIGNAAFSVCSALETVTIADTVTEIGEIAFQLCKKIQEVKLPEGLVTIGSGAFNACSGLKLVYIPGSVLEIGDAAFAAGLNTQDYIVHPDNPNYCSDGVGLLFNKDMTKLIQVPAMRRIVLLPDTLKAIGPSVFSLNQEMIVFFRGTQEQWDNLAVGVGNEMLSHITINCDVNEETYCKKGTHFTVEVEGRDATCTEEGLSDGAMCTICGLMTEEQKVLPKVSHDYQGGKCTMCGVAASPFTDVQTTDWFAGPVLWAVEAGVTGGKTATTFAPNESCTRAQVVTFLWAANGKPEPASMDNPFTDVPDNAWYLKPVLWAVENGITGGISATEFGPEQYCTRAQVVTFLWASAGKPYVADDGGFTDVAATDWYAQPVRWAAKYNITGGIAEGLFGPNQICTRGQVVTFLYKVYG